MHELTALANVRADLALAYSHLGRKAEARQSLRMSLNRDSTAIPADESTLLRITEMRGEFSLDASGLHAAEWSFRKVLSDANYSTVEPVARAYGGLARAAIARQDISQADDYSRRAIEVFGKVTGVRDVRTAPYLWSVPARALLLAGDTQGAVEHASRALDAYRNYEDPSSADITEAERLLHLAQAANASRG